MTSRQSSQNPRTLSGQSSRGGHVEGFELIEVVFRESGNSAYGVQSV